MNALIWIITIFDIVLLAASGPLALWALSAADEGLYDIWWARAVYVSPFFMLFLCWMSIPRHGEPAERLKDLMIFNAGLIAVPFLVTLWKGSSGLEAIAYGAAFEFGAVAVGCVPMFWRIVILRCVEGASASNYPGVASPQAMLVGALILTAVFALPTWGFERELLSSAGGTLDIVVRYGAMLVGAATVFREARKFSAY
jgi:hypothetical protein